MMNSLFSGSESSVDAAPLVFLGGSSDSSCVNQRLPWLQLRSWVKDPSLVGGGGAACLGRLWTPASFSGLLSDGGLAQTDGPSKERRSCGRTGMKGLPGQSHSSHLLISRK